MATRSGSLTVSILILITQLWPENSLSAATGNAYVSDLLLVLFCLSRSFLFIACIGVAFPFVPFVFYIDFKLLFWRVCIMELCRSFDHHSVT